MAARAEAQRAQVACVEPARECGLTAVTLSQGSARARVLTPFSLAGLELWIKGRGKADGIKKARPVRLQADVCVDSCAVVLMILTSRLLPQTWLNTDVMMIRLYFSELIQPFREICILNP